jgi:hypothetical protein
MPLSFAFQLPFVKEVDEASAEELALMQQLVVQESRGSTPKTTSASPEQPKYVHGKKKVEHVEVGFTMINLYVSVLYHQNNLNNTHHSPNDYLSHFKSQP